MIIILSLICNEVEVSQDNGGRVVKGISGVGWIGGREKSKLRNEQVSEGRERKRAEWVTLGIRETERKGKITQLV